VDYVKALLLNERVYYLLVPTKLNVKVIFLIHPLNILLGDN
jgi:hypothetical protein